MKGPRWRHRPACSHAPHAANQDAAGLRRWGGYRDPPDRGLRVQPPPLAAPPTTRPRRQHGTEPSPRRARQSATLSCRPGWVAGQVNAVDTVDRPSCTESGRASCRLQTTRPFRGRQHDTACITGRGSKTGCKDTMCFWFWQRPRTPLGPPRPSPELTTLLGTPCVLARILCRRHTS